MMDEPVSVVPGDVVTGSVVLQRNPVWRRHMSVALSWSVTSTQDPTSQKVRYSAVKSGAGALVLGDGLGGSRGQPLTSRDTALSLHDFSDPPDGKRMLLGAEQETGQEGESDSRAPPGQGPAFPWPRGPSAEPGGPGVDAGGGMWPRGAAWVIFWPRQSRSAHREAVASWGLGLGVPQRLLSRGHSRVS